jgi:hypothetical protein
MDSADWVDTEEAIAVATEKAIGQGSGIQQPRAFANRDGIHHLS